MASYRNRPGPGARTALALSDRPLHKRPEALSAKLEASGPYSPDGLSYADARAAWKAYRLRSGFKGYGAYLTPPTGNAKLAKSSTPNYGLTLAPAEASGFNVCQWSTPECRAACVLVTAGKGTMPSVRRARVVRTRFLAEHPAEAVALIAGELRAAVAKHGAVHVRLNVASDLRWERFAPGLLALPGATFYDYTKAPLKHRQVVKHRPDGPGSTYRLVFSVSERPASEREAVRYLRAGGTAAVVFATKKGAPLPHTWRGFPVIDGDETDGRPHDPLGVVVGLRAKGAGRNLEPGGFIKVPEALPARIVCGCGWCGHVLEFNPHRRQYEATRCCTKTHGKERRS